jgi:hypothetical protein
MSFKNNLWDLREEVHSKVNSTNPFWEGSDEQVDLMTVSLEFTWLNQKERLMKDSFDSY